MLAGAMGALAHRETPADMLPARRNRSSSHYRFASLSQRPTRRRRRALLTTDTELKLIAAAAIIGFSRMPKNGKSTPAATGTPTLL